MGKNIYFSNLKILDKIDKKTLRRKIKPLFLEIVNLQTKIAFAEKGEISNEAKSLQKLTVISDGGEVVEVFNNFL